jgi:hypothetical protein
MTTPSVFKIVSLSTPSAFQSNEKINKIYNTIPCTVKILPLISGEAVNYDNENKLDLSGICTVRLASTSTPVIMSPPMTQYIISSVTGLKPGQIVTFFNDNPNLTYQINFQDIPNSIQYNGPTPTTGPPGYATIGVKDTTNNQNPGVGWASDIVLNGMNFFGGITGL